MDWCVGREGSRAVGRRSVGGVDVWIRCILDSVWVLWTYSNGFWGDLCIYRDAGRVLAQVVVGVDDVSRRETAEKETVYELAGADDVAGAIGGARGVVDDGETLFARGGAEGVVERERAFVRAPCVCVRGASALGVAAST